MGLGHSPRGDPPQSAGERGGVPSQPPAASGWIHAAHSPPGEHQGISKMFRLPISFPLFF